MIQLFSSKQNSILYQLLKPLVLAFAFCSWGSVASAGDISLSESLVGSFKCYKYPLSAVSWGGYDCGVINTGKFSATAKISGDTFDARGMSLADINDATPISIEIGDFQFSSTLGEAVSHKLTSSKITAKWASSGSFCSNPPGCSREKTITYTTIEVSNKKNSVTFKVTGSSRISGIDSVEYGSRIFADICDNAGTGPLEPIVGSLTIGEEVFSTTISGSCSVKSKTVTKYDEEYNLVTTTVKASANFAD